MGHQSGRVLASIGWHTPTGAGTAHNFPRALLYGPLHVLGLHAPRLRERHAVQFLHTIVSTLNCRSSYVAALLRHEVRHRTWISQACSDAHGLQFLLDDWQR